MSENQNQNADEPLPSNGNELVYANTATEGPTSGPEQQFREELHISSKKEILYKLEQMPGLVATGLLPTVRANAMRGIYQTMLANLSESSADGATAIADEDLLAVLRGQPELLRVLKPFLTPAQLDLLVREATK